MGAAPTDVLTEYLLTRTNPVSVVTKTLTSRVIFDLLILQMAAFSSSGIQEIQMEDLMIHTTETWRRGRLVVWARSAISSRIGSVKVITVDPAIRSAVEKQPKVGMRGAISPDIDARYFGTCGWAVSSWLCEIERLAVEGPDISLTGNTDFLDKVADALSQLVNVIWAFSMYEFKKRSLSCDVGADNIVAG